MLFRSEREREREKERERKGDIYHTEVSHRNRQVSAGAERTHPESRNTIINQESPSHQFTSDSISSHKCSSRLLRDKFMYE